MCTKFKPKTSEKKQLLLQIHNESIRLFNKQLLIYIVTFSTIYKIFLVVIGVEEFLLKKNLYRYMFFVIN